MSQPLFDYETRLILEELLYLARQLADYQGIIPFADKDRRIHTDPYWDGPVSEDPHAFVEAVAAEDAPSDKKTSAFIQFAKFDSLCAKFSKDRTYFSNLVELNPNDTIAQAKFREAKGLAMHRNRAIKKMIDQGRVRYFPETYTAEFNLDNGGTWVPWRMEFCPQTEVKKRASRKSK